MPDPFYTRYEDQWAFCLGHQSNLKWLSDRVSYLRKCYFSQSRIISLFCLFSRLHSSSTMPFHSLSSIGKPHQFLWIFLRFLNPTLKNIKSLQLHLDSFLVHIFLTLLLIHLSKNKFTHMLVKFLLLYRNLISLSYDSWCLDRQFLDSHIQVGHLQWHSIL